MYFFRSLTVAVIVFGLAGAGRAAEPFLDKTDLFEAEKGGRALYRIPGIVVTAKGALLAYCEARKNAGGDWGDIDILLRRSTDGGKTWAPARKIVTLDGKFDRNPAAVAQKLGKDGEVTINNPVLIADRDGTVHMLYCVEYGRCFHQRSDDDGVTFGKPTEITPTFDDFRKDYDWKVLATGPAHGIQLSSGRLLVPVWLSRGTGGHAHRPSVVSTVFSDDGGQSWKRGEIVANETDPLINPNETVAVQLADGRVMLNMRSESPQHRRAVSFSKDGATGWTKPTFHDDLPEPICMASTTRLSLASSSDKDRLLFANPNNLERPGDPKPGQPRDRKKLSVRLSYDEGKTWKTLRELEPSWSGYSDLAVGPDGTIYCFYERGSGEGTIGYRTRFLTVARFNLEWLTDGKDSLPAKK
jgi:sialidase-1